MLLVYTLISHYGQLLVILFYRHGWSIDPHSTDVELGHMSCFDQRNVAIDKNVPVINLELGYFSSSCGNFQYLLWKEYVQIVTGSFTLGLRYWAQYSPDKQQNCSLKHTGSSWAAETINKKITYIIASHWNFMVVYTVAKAVRYRSW